MAGTPRDDKTNAVVTDYLAGRPPRKRLAMGGPLPTQPGPVGLWNCRDSIYFQLIRLPAAGELVHRWLRRGRRKTEKRTSTSPGTMGLFNMHVKADLQGLAVPVLRANLVYHAPAYPYIVCHVLSRRSALVGGVMLTICSLVRGAVGTCKSGQHVMGVGFARGCWPVAAAVPRVPLRRWVSSVVTEFTPAARKTDLLRTLQLEEICKRTAARPVPKFCSGSVRGGGGQG